MTQKIAAAAHATLLTACSRIRRADGEEGQGTVEYVGLPCRSASCCWP